MGGLVVFTAVGDGIVVGDVDVVGLAVEPDQVPGMVHAFGGTSDEGDGDAEFLGDELEGLGIALAEGEVIQKRTGSIVRGLV